MVKKVLLKNAPVLVMVKVLSKVLVNKILLKVVLVKKMLGKPGKAPPRPTLILLKTLKIFRRIWKRTCRSRLV